MGEKDNELRSVTLNTLSVYVETSLKTTIMPTSADFGVSALLHLTQLLFAQNILLSLFKILLVLFFWHFPCLPYYFLCLTKHWYF